MKRVFHTLILILWINIFLLSCSTDGQLVFEKKRMSSSHRKVTLRDLADAHALFLGVSTGDHPILNSPDYRNLLAKEFNSITPENALKMGPLRPTQDQYDFEPADTIIDFALENGMQVRGHTLVWSNQLPEWLTTHPWTEEELRNILHEHISNVVGRYKGRIYAWDVVNEAFDKNNDLTAHIWYNVIGPEYIELAFQWAHEADPQAKLFYNDIGAEGLGERSDKIFSLVEHLQSHGIPIHGVGLQYHTRLETAPDPEAVSANIARLANLGLEVHITELDVRLEEPFSEVELAEQAKIYQDVLQVCLDAPNCTNLTMWGLTDKHSWIPYVFPGWGGALIFADLYTPKPAYYAMMDVLITP